MGAGATECSRDLSRRIRTIPVDHRYGTQDLHLLAAELRRALTE